MVDLTGMTSHEPYHNVGVVTRYQGRMLLGSENLLNFYKDQCKLEMILQDLIYVYTVQTKLIPIFFSM